EVLAGDGELAEPGRARPGAGERHGPLRSRQLRGQGEEGVARLGEASLAFEGEGDIEGAPGFPVAQHLYAPASASAARIGSGSRYRGARRRIHRIAVSSETRWPVET